MKSVDSKYLASAWKRCTGMLVQGDLWRLLIFAVAAVASVAVGFLWFSPTEGGQLITKYGYHAIAATTLWWIVSLRRIPMVAVRWWDAMGIREKWQATGLVAGLSVVAWCTFPFSYKVLYDELVLQSTAWNLHYFREVGTMVRGYEIEGVFTSLETYLDKRPYFYAFTVSLWHDLTGYRSSNAFFFNAALLPVLFILFYALARAVVSPRLAWVALACFGATPLLSQNANGSGMDLLNLVMLLATCVLAKRYLDVPDEARLAPFLLTSILLAQSRYESLLFVLPTALIVLEGWRRASRVVLPAVAVLAPLLLVPSALHYTYVSGTPILWELHEGQDTRFALEYLPGNLGHALEYFFDFSNQSLGSWWMAGFGFPAVAVVVARSIWRIRAWSEMSSSSTTVLLFGAAAMANLTLLMAYYWGQLDDPIVARLVLPTTVFLGLAIAWVLFRWGAGRTAAARWIGAGALITYFGWGLPAAEYNRYLNQISTEIDWEMGVVSRLPDVSRLMVTNKTAFNWLIEEIPTVPFRRVLPGEEGIRFHWNHGTFQEILVSQRIRPTTAEGCFQVDPRDVMPDYFVLEPVIEKRIGLRLERISRVVEIKERPDSPRSENLEQNPDAAESMDSVSDHGVQDPERGV